MSHLAKSANVASTRYNAQTCRTRAASASLQRAVHPRANLPSIKPTESWTTSMAYKVTHMRDGVRRLWDSRPYAFLSALTEPKGRS